MSFWLTRLFARPGSRLYLLDYPNERSMHTNPTPRSGGLAIASSFFLFSGILGWFYWPAGNQAWLLIAAILVIALSYIDDYYGLPTEIRFFTHLACALVLLEGGWWLPRLEIPGLVWLWPAAIGIGFSILFIVWMINLYNFMDGLDGLAAGMAVIGFGSFAIFGGMAGDTSFLIKNLIVVAASAGFLIKNIPPATIFMGDTGSALLGLLAAAFSLLGVQEHIFPFWAPLLVFSPFITDATVTLLRRFFRGEKVWQAHKTHYYQRIARILGKEQTLFSEYVLMVACAGSALWAIKQPVVWQWAVIITWIFLYGLAIMVTLLLEGRVEK